MYSENTLLCLLDIKKGVLILSDSKRKYNAFQEIFTRSTFNLLKKVSEITVYG